MMPGPYPAGGSGPSLDHVRISLDKGSDLFLAATGRPQLEVDRDCLLQTLDQLGEFETGEPPALSIELPFTQSTKHEPSATFDVVKDDKGGIRERIISLPLSPAPPDKKPIRRPETTTYTYDTTKLNQSLFNGLHQAVLYSNRDLVKEQLEHYERISIEEEQRMHRIKRIHTVAGGILCLGLVALETRVPDVSKGLSLAFKVGLIAGSLLSWSYLRATEHSQAQYHKMFVNGPLEKRVRSTTENLGQEGRPPEILRLQKS